MPVGGYREYVGEEVEMEISQSPEELVEVGRVLDVQIDQEIEQLGEVPKNVDVRQPVDCQEPN